MKIDSIVFQELVRSWRTQAEHPFDRETSDDEAGRISDAKEQSRDQTLDDCAKDLETILTVYAPLNN